MKGRYLVASIAVCTAMILFLGGAASYGAEKVITLRYANLFPPASKVSMMSDEWCKEVAKRTDGRVKVQYFPAASLSRPSETYDDVMKGIADIGMSFCSYTAGRFPLSEVLDLPLGYKTGYASTKLANAYYEKFKPKEFDGTKVMYLHASPPHRLFTKKPVEKLEDLKGLKIRSTGTSAEVAKALGAVPVAMPMSDAYDALQKGVADGIIGPFEPLIGWKLIDVVNSGTLFSSAYVNVTYVVMNKDKWNSIAPEDQKIIEQINQEWIEKQAKLWSELEDQAEKLFKDKGRKVIVLSKEENDRWTKLLQPILVQYVESMKTKGLPGQEALDFCVEHLKTLQK
jgi:TRAP-type transport system periplasmic protein